MPYLTVLFLVHLLRALGGSGPGAAPPAAFPVDFAYEASPAALAPLDTVVPGHELYFSGEAHRAAGNEARHFALFAYLHQRAGVRYYVKEGSYSYTYFVDKYVQTGHEQWLDTALATLKSGRGPEVEAELTLWRHLRRLNQRVPAAQAIRVVGIDMDPYWSMAVLRDLVRTHGAPPAPLRPAVAELLPLTSIHPLNGMQLHRQDRARLLPVLRQAQAAVRAHPELVQQWLGPDARHWDVLTDNPAAMLRSETNLAGNFNRLRQQLPAGGYFLHYGRLHCQDTNRGWLAERLARQYRVLSFQPYYLNCRVAWSDQPYQDTRWLPAPLRQALARQVGAQAHTLVLPAAADPLRRFARVLLVEQDLRF